MEYKSRGCRDDDHDLLHVRDYRCAATVTEIGLPPSAGNDIVVRRLSTPAGERWGIVRGDDNATKFDFLKVEKLGMALAITSKGNITLVPANKATRSWSFSEGAVWYYSRCDYTPLYRRLPITKRVHLLAGTYFLVNVASNILLSANTFSPNKPLLARPYKPDDTEQMWNVSAQPGISNSFFIGASQGAVSVSVPPKNSVWTNSGNPDDMLAITVDNNSQSKSGWVFTKDEKSNSYNVHDADGNVLSVVKGEDNKRMVVLRSNVYPVSRLFRKGYNQMLTSPRERLSALEGCSRW